MNERIYVVIQFNNGSVSDGYGYIEPGAGVDMTQKIEDIDGIEYHIGNSRCHIDKEHIVEAAHPGANGKISIVLRDCRNQ